MFSTALEETRGHDGHRVPDPKKSGYAKFPNPASLYAMVGVFVGARAPAMPAWR
jgi:aerobic carbon-monoxide dehydrogenase medium subunit